MTIDQLGLNSILSVVTPKSSLDVLSEKREGILKKLNEGTDVNSSGTNKEQAILELKATDAYMQLAVYEEKSRKLEMERLKVEEATAKNAHERGKVLAKHEGVLYNASMNKLLSANRNCSGFKDMAGAGMPMPHDKVLSQTDSDSYLPRNLMEKADVINRDVKESTELGIAAARVALRRKSNSIKENTEEAINKRAAAKRKSRKHINVTV